MRQDTHRVYRPAKDMSRQTVNRRRARRIRRRKALTRAARPHEVRQLRRTLLLGLYFTLAFELAAAVFSSPLMAVRRESVSGVGALPVSEVTRTMRAASLTPGTNWLRAPAGQVENRLRQLPWVGRCSVGRQVPFGIAVHVVPRQPIALLACGGSNYEIDRGGVVIRTVRPEDAALLPSLVAPDVQAKLGAAVRRAPISASLRIIDALHLTVPSRVAKIEVDQNDSLCLNMKDGLKIVFGPAEDIDAKLDVIKRLYARRPDVGRELLSVNVTSPLDLAAVPRVTTAAAANTAVPTPVADITAQGNRSKESQGTTR